ncbi:MAG: GntR family transcriptional regulator [Desulfovermiculus sp.]|nr:GntR family transcriptional regulator [Desulfovermiculus sp.]
MGNNSSIYDVLKKRIVLLDYEPGQVLREKELIDEFGVSRTPVREALIRLEMDGLVRILPNLGTIVSEVSFQQLKDVIEVRSHLILLAGQLAAARITKQELNVLRHLIEQMDQEEDPKQLMELDTQAHDLINQATKNEMLVKMLGQMRDLVVRIWFYFPSNDNYYNNLSEEFEELEAALKAEDQEESARLLEKHTQRFIDHIRGQFSF